MAPRCKTQRPGCGQRPARPAALALLFLAVWLLSHGALCWAQTDDPAPQSSASGFSVPPPPYWKNRGRWDFGVQLGLAVQNPIPHDISHIALLIAQPQVGFIVRDSHDPHPLVQRCEIVNEGIFGNAIHPGGRLLGYALLFRFDTRPGHRAVPVFDLGAGVQYTTVGTRAPELSGRLQFSPQLGLGIQYFFNPQRALVLEYRYMHMSNAGIQPPNLGFNASMLTIGFRWLRRPRGAAWQTSAHHSHNPFRHLFGGR